MAETLHDLSNFPLCMAPMVGLSHAAFRALAREYMPTGAQTIWPTEMLNSRKLPIENWDQTLEVRKCAADEGPLVPQMLGNDEASIAASTQLLEAWGARGIDINMGCPVKKALRHNYGVALMGDPGYASEVVKMATRSTALPVSVKLRAGPQGDLTFLKSFVSGLIDSGASWVTLHPRTSEQKRRGRAEWAQIGFLKKEFAIPVIGNGDIQVVEDIHRMRRETGCDLVMAGRTLTARPWLFWQLGEDLGFQAPAGRSGEAAPRSPEEEAREYGRSLRRFIYHLRELFGENDQSLRRLKFYVRTGAVWLDFGQKLTGLVSGSKTLTEADHKIETFFQSSLAMVERTELRQ